jgi:hypothetical protein
MPTADMSARKCSIHLPRSSPDDNGSSVAVPEASNSDDDLRVQRTWNMMGPVVAFTDRASDPEYEYHYGYEAQQPIQNGINSLDTTM